MFAMFDHYYHIQQILSEHAVSSGKYNLKYWNKVQMDIMKELEKRHLINTHNIDQVLSFAKKFSDFVDDHNDRIPSVEEMAALVA